MLTRRKVDRTLTLSCAQDSMLLVDDGTTVVLNGNDCKLDAEIEVEIKTR